MKKIVVFVSIVGLIIVSCKQKTEPKIVITENFEVFGDTISDTNSLDKAAMFAKFQSMKVGDTINIKFTSTIDDVCSKKGCWMKLPLTDSLTTMVRFKDYGFFMPLDSKNREVIVEGKAFVQETSVDDLKHYAADAGKTEEEIAKITSPKIEYAFEAHGVLMKK